MFTDKTSTNLCDYVSTALLVSIPVDLGTACDLIYLSVTYLNLGAINSRFVLLYNSYIRCISTSSI